MEADAAADAPGPAVLASLAVATFTAMLPNSILIPGFAEIAAGLGVPYGSVGLLITVYTLAYVAATPFVGVLADRVGRRAVLVPALVLFGLGGLVPFVLRWLPAVLVGRAVMGLGGAGILSVVFAILGDLYAGPRRSRATGVVSGTIAASDALVPFLGGLLAAVSWLAPFAAYLLAFPAALGVALLVPATPVEGPTTLRAYVRGAVASLRDGRIQGVYGATLVLSFVYFGLLVLVPLLAAARWGAGSVLAGSLILVLGAAWAVAAALLPRLRVHRRVVLVGAFALQVPAIVLAFRTASLAGAALGFLLWGAGLGVTFTGLVDRMTTLAPPSHRGVVASLFNATTLVGLGTGPLILARLARPSAPWSAVPWAAGLLLLAMLLAVPATGGSPEPAAGA